MINRMVKESLYCIPYQSNIKRRKNAIVYHCDKDDGIQPAAESPKICNRCNKEFQDDRCLKIHKTKMNHWGSSYNDPEHGPKRKPSKQPTRAKRAKKPSTKRKRSDDDNSVSKRFIVPAITAT